MIRTRPHIKSSMGGMIFFSLILFGFLEAGAQAPNDREQTVTVERIKPADLPKASESKMPAVLQSKNVLPRPATLKELRALGGKVRPTIVRVVAIHEPRSSLQRTPILLEGHAVWLSTKSGEAVLVSPHHWLSGAKTIYALPWEKMESGGVPKARVVGMNAASARSKLRALEREKARVELKITSEDKHRNLAQLVVADPDAPGFVVAPASPLTFFDVERQSPTNVFGLSPMLGPDAQQTIFLTLDSRDEVLAYYLQCDYPAFLGAPIVAIDGGIVALTAMPHPTEAGRTLVIPPLALKSYVETIQGVRDPKLREEIDDPDKNLPE